MKVPRGSRPARRHEKGLPRERSPSASAGSDLSQDAALRPKSAHVCCRGHNLSAAVFGSLRIIPEGCKPGVYVAPRPVGVGPYPSTCQTPSSIRVLVMCVLPSSIEAACLTTSAGMLQPTTADDISSMVRRAISRNWPPGYWWGDLAPISKSSGAPGPSDRHRMTMS